MGRIARVAAPGYPHHVVQRGDRRRWGEGQRNSSPREDWEALGR